MNGGRAGLWLLCLLAACETGPQRSVDAVDPRRYAECPDPQGAEAWAQAQAALAKGDDAAALTALRRTIELCPDLVRAHRAYQDVARRLGGEVAQAMVAYYRALPASASPVPEYMRARLAETSYAQGNALQAILARDASFAWAHFSRGRVSRRQGQLLQALDSFRAAVDYDESLHEARLERAQVLVELGRYEEGAVDYDAYLRSMPQDEAATRAHVSLLLYRLDRIDQAMRLLDGLEARRPGDLSLRMDRAAAHWRARRPTVAIEAYLGILAEKPTEARAALNIGLLYYEVLPNNEAERRRYWPKARAAFRLFLQTTVPQDGHEQFERTLAVPYRLGIIAELLGTDDGREVTLDDLRLPAG